MGSCAQTCCSKEEVNAKLSSEIRVVTENKFKPSDADQRVSVGDYKLEGKD
jgi:hypothetical protein